MKDVLGVILGGGRGARLYPLTRHRSEPAVPIAGKYRLIDIPISNCLNGGVNRMFVLTQYLSVSLHRHIANTYKLSPFSQGFIEVLPAQQTNEAASWYAGTADALRQNLRYLQDHDTTEVLILSGDQLYRMDFAGLVRGHRASGADVTLAVVPVPRRQTPNVGVVRLDDADRVTDLVEKPQAAGQLEAVRTPADWLQRRGLAWRGAEYLANMGIYLFSRRVLFDLLQAHPDATDLVTEVLARILRTRHVRAHLFTGYWEDLGTIKSYHEANIALAGDDPPFDFASPEGVIYTRMRNLPASLVSASRLEQCLISDGCFIDAGTRIERSVIGVRTRVGRNVTLRDAVVNGADRCETDAERRANRARGVPDLGIGDNAVVERAVLDRDCRIGAGAHIINRRGVQEDEGPGYVIRDGIVIIPNGTLVPDGTVI
jgi:glucose-1-phosphate adenylyltransferase